VVSKLRSALDEVVALPAVQAQINQLGMLPGSPTSLTELQHFIDAEIVRWGKVVQQAGLAGTE
jgi:tripartite-type tricarboxylate transporter receptor subunit TctC